MGKLLTRVNGWVAAHPVLWAVAAGVVLVLVGVALGLPPVVVAVVGAAVGALNVWRARRRGYCPLPGPPPDHAATEAKRPD